jgi:serine/threonine-protein kinase SRPK3
MSSCILLIINFLVSPLGELRHITKLRYWPLDAVLHDKYLFPTSEADILASFLTPMLRLNPDKRAKASELMHHNWLDGVVVQGEIDVIRRAEEEEERQRKRLLSGSAQGDGGEGSGAGAGGAETEGSSAAQGTKRKLELDEAESDAMKPVDETLQPLSALEGEGEGEDGDGADGDGDITMTDAPPSAASTSGTGQRPTLDAPKTPILSMPPEGKAK